MKKLNILFQKNQDWAALKTKDDPEYFLRMSKSQDPNYLWIGCSDSRVPANEIVGLEPGQLFVHRNVANLVPNTDLNCLSVLEFGVDLLNIQHIIVCGHYGCNGVKAAMEGKQIGLVDNWVRNIGDVYARFQYELDAIKDKDKRFDRLVELNVIQQVMNVCHTTIVQNAWRRGQPLWVHGWVYDLATGTLKDLDCCISGLDQVEKIYRLRFPR